MAQHRHLGGSGRSLRARSSSLAPAPASLRSPDRALVLAALPTALAILGHSLGLLLYVNWADVLDNPPIHYTDYAVHFAGTEAVCRFLEEGQLWGYSPFFHAGFAEGTIFNVDNKAVELASCALHRAGLRLPVAFNLIVLTMIALAPFSVFVAARLCGIRPGVAGVAQLMALALWYGDPTVHWMWQGGTLSFVTAALGGLVVGAAFWRWAGLAADTRSGSSRAEEVWSGAVWFGLGALVFWVHALAFVILVLPLSLGTIWAWRGWTWRKRLVPVLWGGWVVLTNWPWLGIALRFLATKTRSDQFLQGGLPQLIHDGRSAHFLYRVAVLALAGVGVWWWHRSGRRFSVPLALSIAAWVGLAYLGSVFGAGDLQPYRFIAPALLLACLPAADALAQPTGRAPRWTLAVGVALALTAVLPLYQARPRRIVRADGTLIEHLSGPTRAERAVCATIRGLELQSGRVLTNDWRLGAYLPTCSGAQVIGGPSAWVFTIYGYSNAGGDDIFGRPVASLGPDELIATLGAYNVRWLVVDASVPPHGLRRWMRDHPGRLSTLMANRTFAVVAVPQPASWFWHGSGQVSASYNRLEVRNASPGGVGLKYHWLDSLRTDPELPLRPVHIGADPVPFIAVDNGDTRDFAIVQRY